MRRGKFHKYGKSKYGRGNTTKKSILDRKYFKANVTIVKRKDKCDSGALPVFTSNVVGKSDWIIDSGAAQYMSFERDRLTEYVEFKQPCVVNLGNSCRILAYGKGTHQITSDC